MERHLSLGSLGSAELLRRESAPGRSGSLFEADRLFTPGRMAPDEDGVLMLPATSDLTCCPCACVRLMLILAPHALTPFYACLL